MVQILRRLRAGFVPALVLAGISPAANAPRFYPDDPIWRVPKPVAVKNVAVSHRDDLFDFVYQSVRPAQHANFPAGGVNTLGEVPNSAWYTNRHASRRMTTEELQRGPCISEAPAPPFIVIGAKTDGVTPGFRMRDAKGRQFFVKPDPRSNPEMATGADAVGARFFYALGYNTPENFLTTLHDGDLQISPDAKVVGVNGKPRPMTHRDIELIILRVPRKKDGSLRVVASLAVEGHTAGPFDYEGTRSDDPNDLVPHQDRRDLRGLHVFSAWLNHTDVKSHNSLDTVVEENGVRYVKHYLIDFGSIMGSDSDMPKDARFGYEYILPTPHELLVKMAELGLAPEPWETARYPHDKAVGRFESKIFDPLTWKPNYPNPAFERMRPDDAYWAAKKVMAFTDQDIRAIIEAGRYSRPETVDYLVKTLVERRQKIGRTYLQMVLPLEEFRIEGDRMLFVDLSERYGFTPHREFITQWFEFDNMTGKLSATAGLASIRSEYGAARISETKESAKNVTVFFKRSGNQSEMVGIERAW